MHVVHIRSLQRLLTVRMEIVKEFTLNLKMVADKTAYAPGSDITYTFPVALICPPEVSENDCNIDHCTDANFILDPNLENIRKNVPDIVEDEQNYAYLDAICLITKYIVTDANLAMWYGVGTDVLWLPAFYNGDENNYDEKFTIIGRIKDISCRDYYHKHR